MAEIRSRLWPIGDRARAARDERPARVRSDIDAPDLPIIQLMLSTLVDASRDVSPDLWRRYLGTITRGLSCVTLSQEPELETPPLPPDQVDHVMSFLKPARR